VTLRSGHGRGRGQPRVEVLPADELPKGLQAPALVESTAERTKGGRFAPGARTVQSAGGQARRGKTRLASKLGLSTVVTDATFEPYKRAAEDFKRTQVTALARGVGGGHCGPAPSSIVASAALQLAASRWAFDRGDPELGSKLANDSRQNLLAAHELCAKEAKNKPGSSGIERLRRHVLGGGK
jgi:hypothetical protein